ncbi:histidine phosphatase family protein [Tepidibacillus infernus]|uniref:histidine phosphatase family protein n=1 Tax=Tepidibacillus infernus TaxID=1806172 RepID=UPI003B69CC95
MNFYLLRHGLTKWNEKGILLGSSDPPLLDQNDDQILKWVPFLQQHRVEMMVHSGMKRTIETMQIIRKQLNMNIPFMQDERLKELNFGDWELKDYDGLYQNQQELFVKWLHDPWQISPPNGETLQQLKSRLISFFDQWVEESASQSMLVITHGGPIRVLYSMIHHTSFYELNVRPGSLFYLNWQYKEMREVDEGESKDG